MNDLFGQERPPRKKNFSTHQAGALTREAQRLVDWWNEDVAGKCRNVPRITGCSEKAQRTKLLRARINDPEFMSSLDSISAAICRNRFLRGDRAPTNGHPNWRCSFEWICTGDNWRKVVEGYYAHDDDPIVHGGLDETPAAPARKNRLLTVTAQTRQPREDQGHDR